MENETVMLILHSQLLRYSRYRIKCLTAGNAFYRVVKLRQNLPEIAERTAVQNAVTGFPLSDCAKGVFSSFVK